MASQSKEVLPPWGFAIAGATGAVLANAAVYPLDIVKTKLQVQVSKSAKKPSATTSPAETAIVPTTTTTTTTTDAPTYAEKADPEKPTANGSLPAPAAAEEVERYDSTLDAIIKIIAKSGWGGLYAGMAGSLIGVASTNFAYFYWYTIVRTFYQKRTGTTALSTVTELSLGAVAGALAQLFTIPVAVVTTRQQTRPYNAPALGLIDTAKEVLAEDGITGLWRGLKASLVLVVNPAITYGSYQKFRELLFQNRARLTMGESFLLGALSKAVATCATQPLIVAKVGLQSRPPPERNGKPFKSFLEVMRFIIEHEGLLGLFKGIGPQITKGLLVQGLLMMTKERMELFFIVMFKALKNLRQKRLAERAALVVKETAGKV